MPEDDAGQLPNQPIKAARLQARHIAVQLGLDIPMVAFHHAGGVLISQIPIAEAGHPHVCRLCKSTPVSELACKAKWRYTQQQLHPSDEYVVPVIRTNLVGVVLLEVFDPLEAVAEIGIQALQLFLHPLAQSCKICNHEQCSESKTPVASWVCQAPIGRQMR